MTYQSEPTRWTESPGDAPELLRSAIRACADEGPSDYQMRSLALKLAVVGGGAAVIASAASAAASASAASVSAAGAGVASAGTLAASGGSALTFAKVAAVSVALIGAAATGAVLVRRDAAPSEAVRQRAPIAAPVAQSVKDEAQLPVVEPRVAPAVPAVERTPSTQSEREVPVAPAPAPAVSPTQPASATSVSVNDARASDARAAKRAERREARHQARITARDTSHTRASEAPVSQVELPRELPRSARGASAGELELLHHARAALSVRPLSAFALTEQHRSTYPSGVFTQERDAIAVEALLRAGDLSRAQSLAERFIEKYPSSPHAHRFRETMKLQ